MREAIDSLPRNIIILIIASSLLLCFLFFSLFFGKMASPVIEIITLHYELMQDTVLAYFDSLPQGSRLVIADFSGTIFPQAFVSEELKAKRELFDPEAYINYALEHGVSENKNCLLKFRTYAEALHDFHATGRSSTRIRSFRRDIDFMRFNSYHNVHPEHFTKERFERICSEGGYTHMLVNFHTCIESSLILTPIIGSVATRWIIARPEREGRFSKECVSSTKKIPHVYSVARGFMQEASTCLANLKAEYYPECSIQEVEFFDFVYM